MNQIIRVKIKQVYGRELIYVTSEHREYLEKLTRKSTIDRQDIKSLEALGFSFMLQSPTL